ncbi:MAG: cupredoxin domain-containing protein [Chloroflexi bacterium]|nr:cupredoxin domain-containing protein [Chloroflexota bacterium]
MADMTLTTIGGKTHPFYTRVAVAGLLLNGLVSLVFAVLSLIDGEASTVAFFIIYMALSAISVGLMWRFNKWALVVGAIWGFVNLWWGWFLILALSYPNSFFDFVMPLLLTFSALLTGVGATVALVQQRRGTARIAATRTERRTFGAIAIVLLGIVILSGILHIAGRTTGSAEAKAGATVVQMKNSYLAPERLELRVGETAIILLKNNDFFLHTFEIDEFAIERTVLPFGELLIELRPTNTGEFTFRSKAYMTGDMEGTLVVTK